MPDPVSTPRVPRPRAGAHVDIQWDDGRAAVDTLGVAPATGRGAGCLQREEPADRRRPDPALMETLPPGYAVLVIQRGPKAGETLVLDCERTLVGRQADADICLDHVTVSRRHAELLPQGDGHLVRDVGSLNGTYVNGDRVDAIVLRPGDEVRIGKYRLAYYPACPLE